ncbi:MAG: penicillin-binding protein 1A [Lysobacteraceae bacterium]
MPKLRRLLRLGLYLSLAAVLIGGITLGVLYWLIAPTLPDVSTLRDVELQEPLTVTSTDGKLIALFGETRRYPVKIGNVPERVKQAVIAIEDARFYEHPGVDWRGVTRAVWLLATSDKDRVPGGSTITQQVAKQFFLSNEYSYTRKLTEMFLALKMERELGKDEILELYLNKGFFGHRSYGIAAAAEFYYGKTLEKLTLAECAMLASIPKFPSSGNPITNPERALVRRNYVLERMHEVGFISAAELAQAQAEANHAHPHEPPVELDAPYAAEIVRQAAVDRYGAGAMTDGYHYVTTLVSANQEAANLALREALLEYDHRHGWRGAEAKVDLASTTSPDDWARSLRPFSTISGLTPGLVTQVDADTATVYLEDGQSIVLDAAAMTWAAPYKSEDSRGPRPKSPGDILFSGDVIRVTRNDDGEWMLAQLPRAQGAIVSLDPEDGAILAMSGGFSFSLNKFNRATQAKRQPGSSFKPFVYAAAFDRGFNPASIVLDAPVVFHNRSTGETWQPQNDNADFAGPMRLREAMVTSRNLVSVRLLDAIGIPYARDYIQRFGFEAESLPPNLSMALGTAALAPLEVARGYAVFANGGYRVDPYLVREVRDRNGTVVQFTHVPTVCANCPERLATGGPESTTSSGEGGFDLSIGGSRQSPVASTALDVMGPPERLLAPEVIDERTTWLISSLMRDVVRRGTGRRAMSLGRNDLGGKTGTTNDHRDAWFSGFGGGIVTTAWVGMDDFSSLGRGEFGSAAALPMWMGYMDAVLEGVDEVLPPMPPGVVTALIDPDTGLLAAPGSANAISESFKREDITRLRNRSIDNASRTSEQEAFDIF